jgi:hypothetical protein
VCSVSYTGWVEDTSGVDHYFYRGRCLPLGGAHLIQIVFTGN